MDTEFALPELGEGVDAGDVLKILVGVGDTVARDQPILELETDKATIEVPVTFGGRVKEVRVKEGDKVRVGQVIVVLTDAEPAEATAPVSVAAEPERAGGDSRPRPAPLQQPEASAERPSPPPVTEVGAGGRLVPAAPSVRRLARELGVDVAQVEGSGPAGRITEDDVKGHARWLVSGPPPGLPAPVAAPALPSFEKWGPVAREPWSGVRRKTAEHLSEAWTAPHVTQHDRADITHLEELRLRYGKKVEASGGKLTMTAIALKIAASALKVFPKFNASIDLARQETVYKKYFHIGVAVATDRGLLVPVIRDVDRKNVLELSVELAQVAEKARSRKLGLEDMQGGTFTITNLGGIGGTAFTPILNWPEVAILGISRSSMEPVFVGGQFVPRLILPLSLSYDHRLIDGADAAAFLRWVAEAFESPFLLSLEG